MLHVAVIFEKVTRPHRWGGHSAAQVRWSLGRTGELHPGSSHIKNTNANVGANENDLNKL